MGDIREEEGPEFDFEHLRLSEVQVDVKLKVSSDALVDYSPHASLLAISSKFGYTVVGTSTGFAMIPTQHIISAMNQSAKNTAIDTLDGMINVPVKDKVIHVRLDMNELRILVSTCSGKLLVFDASGVQSQHLEPSLECKFNVVNSSVSIVDVAANPEANPNLCAILFSHGQLGMLDLGTGTTVYSPETLGHVTCMNWSRKGKQLAIGTTSGSIVQITPEFDIKNTILPPESAVDELDGQVAVSYLSWVEPKVFLCMYTNNEEEPRTCVYAIQQSGQPKTTTFTKLLDPCFPENLDQGYHYYGDYITQWGDDIKYLFFLANRSSSDIPAIGAVPKLDGLEWGNWVLPEGFTASIPLKSDTSENHVCGLAIDFTNTITVPPTNPEDPPLPASPVLLILVDEGYLLGYHCLNTKTTEPCPSMKVPASLPSTASLPAKPCVTDSHIQPAAPLFGAGVTTSQSVFGAKAPDSTSQSVFGAKAPDSTATSAFGGGAGFSFGQPAKSTDTSAPLFGGNSTDTSASLFGGKSTDQPSLFGSKPADQSPSLFGAKPVDKPTSLFGAKPSDQPSLFGAKSSDQSTSLFGANGTAATKTPSFQASATTTLSKPKETPAKAAPTANGLFSGQTPLSKEKEDAESRKKAEEKATMEATKGTKLRDQVSEITRQIETSRKSELEASTTAVSLLNSDKWKLCDLMRISRACTEVGADVTDLEKNVSKFKGLHDKTLDGLIQLQAKSEQTGKLVEFLKQKMQHPEKEVSLTHTSLGPEGDQLRSKILTKKRQMEMSLNMLSEYFQSKKEHTVPPSKPATMTWDKIRKSIHRITRHAMTTCDRLTELNVTLQSLKIEPEKSPIQKEKKTRQKSRFGLMDDDEVVDSLLDTSELDHVQIKPKPDPLAQIKAQLALPGRKVVMNRRAIDPPPIPEGLLKKQLPVMEVPEERYIEEDAVVESEEEEEEVLEEVVSEEEKKEDDIAIVPSEQVKTGFSVPFAPPTGPLFGVSTSTSAKPALSFPPPPPPPLVQSASAPATQPISSFTLKPTETKPALLFNAPTNNVPSFFTKPSVESSKENGLGGFSATATGLFGSKPTEEKPDSLFFKPPTEKAANGLFAPVQDSKEQVRGRSVSPKPVLSAMGLATPQESGKVNETLRTPSPVKQSEVARTPSPVKESETVTVARTPSPAKEPLVAPRAPSPVKEPVPVARTPSPVKEPAPVARTPSPVKEPAPVARTPSPVKEPAPVARTPSPVKETVAVSAPVARTPSPVKEPTANAARAPSPAKEPPPARTPSPVKEPVVAPRTPSPAKEPETRVNQTPSLVIPKADKPAPLKTPSPTKESPTLPAQNGSSPTRQQLPTSPAPAPISISTESKPAASAFGGSLFDAAPRDKIPEDQIVDSDISDVESKMSEEDDNDMAASAGNDQNLSSIFGGNMLGTTTNTQDNNKPSVFGLQSTTAATPSSFGSAFGSAAPSTGAFGSSAFGAPSAFGSSNSTTAFGSQPNAFSKPTAFGSVTSAPAFGSVTSAPAFGSVTTPAFASSTAAPAFGSSTFGQSSLAPPSLTSTQQATAPAFGSTSFGQASFGTPSSFGSSGFGAPFGSNLVKAAQSLSGGGTGFSNFASSNAPSFASMAQQAPATVFGQTPSQSSTFGSNPSTAFGSSTSGFGAPSAFGSGQSTFGQGGFQSAQPSAFGANGSTFGSNAPSAFGQASSFGSSQPAAFGSVPTTQATSAFGQGSTFGSSSSNTSSFGGSSFTQYR